MKKVSLQKLKDDPLCMRASIGGWADKGYYCSFRGDQKQVTEMLRTVLTVLENAPLIEEEDDFPTFGVS